jgi:hypothetical protein
VANLARPSDWNDICRIRVVQVIQRWKRQLRQRWAELKASQPGERFQAAYHRQKRADQGRSAAARWVRPILALLSFAIGVVLAFIPGPAVLFFALSATLLATQSLRVARGLDQTEVWLRAQRAKLRRKPRARRA